MARPTVPILPVLEPALSTAGPVSERAAGALVLAVLHTLLQTPHPHIPDICSPEVLVLVHALGDGAR